MVKSKLDELSTIMDELGFEIVKMEEDEEKRDLGEGVVVTLPTLTLKLMIKNHGLLGSSL